MQRMAMVLVLVALGVVPSTAGQAKRVRVWSGNMQGWVFVDDSTGEACSTPDCGLETVAQPLAGDGSARLAVSDPQNPTKRSMLFAPIGKGRRLRDLRALSYAAYVWDITSSPFAPAVAIPIDFDLGDRINEWQGRMIFNPAWQPGFADLRNAWRRFDAVDGRLAWWYFEVPAGADNRCPEQHPCTLAEILEMFPDAGIHRTYGGIGIYVGDWNQQHIETSVDLVTLGVKSKLKVYDFEPGGPETYQECRQNGWMGYYDDQQQCIAALKHPAPAPDADGDADPDAGLAPTSYKECKYNGWVGFYASQDDCVRAFK